MTGIEVISLSKNNKAYQCLICQNIFSKKNLYQNHLRLHGKESGNPYHCDICGKSFAVPARLTRHYRTHTGEKPFQCEYCSKSFSVKENLSVHRRIHTKERPYKCNICESAFEHSGKLHRHMRIHTGERPHKCSLCTKTFIQSGQLVIHMRTHTGEKPYICKSCGKGFTCSKQLKVHTRTHTGEKPYKCEICNKTFGYNHVLKLHQVAHYGEKLYKCTLCQETFTSKKLMELHIKNHSDSSICNLSKSTQLFYETTKNVNKMILCNKNNNTTDNKMFIIKAVNEKTISKISEAIKNAEKYVGNATNLSLYRSSKEKFNQIENITRSSLNTDKPHVIKNTNSRCCFTNNDLTNANSQVTTDKEFLSDNYLLTSRLSSNNKSHIEQYVNLYDLPRQQSLKKLKGDKYVTTYYNSESTHNYLISERNSIVSLPPRKRSKMILESMKEENFEILPTRRFNSVIKFATSDNMNFEIH